MDFKELQTRAIAAAECQEGSGMHPGMPCLKSTAGYRQTPPDSVVRRLQMEEGAAGDARSRGGWGGPGSSQAGSRAGSRAGSQAGSRSPTRGAARREGHVSAAAASARALGRAGVPERLPAPEDVTSVRCAARLKPSFMHVVYDPSACCQQRPQNF